jgi:Trypsin-like peptidase domain
MENLTKQQIVLVTLLVSFVTSIATGIVTVSLMDQAPKGVTQTINNVVEHTIERVVPSNSTTGQSAAAADGVISVQDELADAVDRSSQSLVRIERLNENGLSGTITGFGIVVSKDGVIITDKSTISMVGASYAAIFSDNTMMHVTLFQSQNNGDIAFLLAQPTSSADVQTASSTSKFLPISFATKPLRLGESVFAIGGSADVSVNGAFQLAQGFISSTDTATTISTSIPSKSVAVGGPLINSSGEFVGMRTASLDTDDTATFYPLSLVKAAIPKEGTFTH